MIITLVSIGALIVGALSMSVHFGTWLVERPMRTTTSGAVFTEIHQGRDAIAARVMPVLGNVAILLVGATAYLVRGHSISLGLAVAALVFFLADMTVTLTKNVPLNKQVQSWAIDAPPADWSKVRDAWERFHSIRTGLIVTGFSLLVAAIVLTKLC